jgi:trans-2-enoyl-CoA reductase
MAVATYPFFDKCAELVGRLSNIQGDCASAEVHRHVIETYGRGAGRSRGGIDVVWPGAIGIAKCDTEAFMHVITQKRI